MDSVTVSNVEELENKVEEKSPEQLGAKVVSASADVKVRMFLKSKHELEQADYNSPEYKLFAFNVLGETEIRDRDDINMITRIAESDRGIDSFSSE